MSLESNHKLEVLKNLSLLNILSFAKQIVVGFFRCIGFKNPKMMSNKETLNYLIENKCSMVRFGDGEIMIAAGNNLDFQQNSDGLMRRMQASMTDTSDKNILVCFPDFLVDKFYKEKVFDNTFWRYRHFYEYTDFWKKHINYNYLYGNANVSRPYITFKNKSNCKDYFERFKKLWEERDILIAEGEKSRLGVGNNLFDNARSIKRILCPQSQCYGKYDEILSEIKKYSTDHLVLLSIGPSASIMPRDLAPLGYQALDIGNIDTEYEWFLAGAKERIAVNGKFFYEAQNSSDVDCVADEKYFEQIVAKIL